MRGVAGNLQGKNLPSKKKNMIQEPKFRCVPNLVAKTFGGNDGNFIADTLVGLEIERELGIVALNNHFRRLFDGLKRSSASGIDRWHSLEYLCANATHIDGCYSAIRQIVQLGWRSASRLVPKCGR